MLSSQEVDVPGSQIPTWPCDYRQATPVPVGILDQCTVCLEEGLYCQGLSLLHSVLSAGHAASTSAYVPPVQYLSLAATLIVHPSLTTRTLSTEKQAASDAALQYLTDVCRQVGPQASGLDRALNFNGGQSAARSKRTQTRRRDSLSGDQGGEHDPAAILIQSKYARADCLYRVAEDFWSIVGWAFNCSVLRNSRWERWKLWLALMLDILDRDLDSRLRRATTESGVTPADALDDCLLARYLSTVAAGRNSRRRVMRAIFTDGRSKAAVNEFGEIWKNETRSPKQKQFDSSLKRKVLDLENDEFGDYDNVDSENELAPVSSKRTFRAASRRPNANDQNRPASRDTDQPDDADVDDLQDTGAGLPGGDVYGGIESIALRQRVLALLAKFCAINSTVFGDIENLLDLFAEFMKPMPLPVYQHMLLPTKTYLSLNTQASLDQGVLRTLLSSTAPVYKDNSLTQQDFESHFAPFPANNTSILDHAKLSLLVEDLLRLLWRSGGLLYSPSLRRAVTAGIKAREQKADFDGRKKVNARVKEDQHACMVLRTSADRMLVLLDVLQSR